MTLHYVQVMQLVAEVEEDGVSLEEVRQKAKSYWQGLDERRRDLERVEGEKEKVEQQLSNQLAELQAQLSSATLQKDEAEKQASSNGLKLESLRTLHSSCEEGANKMRELLEMKETELSRVLSALQVAAAQISALGRKEVESRSPSTITGEVGWHYLTSCLEGFECFL